MAGHPDSDKPAMCDAAGLETLVNDILNGSLETQLPTSTAAAAGNRQNLRFLPAISQELPQV
jgi:hypothetical protein